MSMNEKKIIAFLRNGKKTSLYNEWKLRIEVVFAVYSTKAPRGQFQIFEYLIKSNKSQKAF